MRDGLFLSLDGIDLFWSMSMLTLAKFSNAIYQDAARGIRESRHIFNNLRFLTIRLT